MTQILVIDNHDSFVYTIVSYLEQLGAQVTVLQNDAVDLPSPAQLCAAHQGILISPGPGTPQQAGISMQLIRAAAAARVPLLGVCLGHQALAAVYGATIHSAPELLHGQTSRVRHSGDEFFAGVPKEFTVTRYHSLAVDPQTVPAELIVTARTADGTIMALRHRSLPMYAVQYHPESVLTEYGHRQLANWLEVVGVTGAVKRARQLQALLHPAITSTAAALV